VIIGVSAQEHSSMSAGTQLQQARIERKLSITQVSAATRIQPWVLEALEADQVPAQMSRIYLRGFLGSYARFLHLDAAVLLLELPSDEPAAEQVAAAPPLPTPPPITIPWRLLARVAVASVAAALVAVVIVLDPIRRISQLPWPKLQLPTIAIAKSQPARAAAKPHASKSTVQAPAKPVKPVAVAVLQTSPAGPAVAPAASIESQVASIAPLQKTLRPPQLPSLETQATHPLEVLMTASHTTWVRVRADGKLLAQERLKRGAKERWKAKNRLELIVANPSQVELSLNGQSITPHAIAYQGKLLITHRGVTQLQTPE
jgi:cytoskeletal protein RodZ